MLYDVVQVGPVKNGRQTVSLPSVKNNVYVQCEADKEDVDKFLSQRKKIENKAAKKSLLTIGLGTVAGALIGLASKTAESVGSRSGIGAVIGMTAGAMCAIGVCLRADNKKAKLNDRFIAENSKSEVEKADEE